MKDIHVNLAERSYLISIGAELLNSSAHFLSLVGKRRVAIVSNTTVAPLYAQKVIDTFCAIDCSVSLFEIEDGEQYKNIDTFTQVVTFLLENNYNRDCVIVALGGGVIGDIAGFVSASYQRGVDFIQIPTTLLAQVDSSVGGKTAVNHFLGKNMIGAFYQPKTVIIDIHCLQTLPKKELIAGMAEVIKYGIIFDYPFFEWLDDNMDKLYALEEDALVYAISRCCQIKADIVSQDEKESGVRALLNLGHTFGHAIEAEMGYGNWLHGEAVSVGIIMASMTAEKLGLMQQADVERIVSLLNKAKLPLKAPKEMNPEVFMKHMMRDKKVLSNKLRLVLPTSIGSAEVIENIDSDILFEVIEQFGI